jgi:hypothetical protein
MTDVGGIYQCLILVIFCTNFPISRFSFFLKAIKRLYLARTRDDHIFGKINNKKLSKHKNLIFLKNNNLPD